MSFCFSYFLKLKPYDFTYYVPRQPQFHFKYPCCWIFGFGLLEFMVWHKVHMIKGNNEGLL